MRAGVIVYNPFLDKILLIYRWKNRQEYFVIPGGTIELGEGPLEAALREMKEEVNLSFSADQLHTAFSLNNQGKEEYYFYTELYTAETPSCRARSSSAVVSKTFTSPNGSACKNFSTTICVQKALNRYSWNTDAGKFEKLKHL